jgi:putative Mg2+ transporter-C (MgtC) family protein
MPSAETIIRFITIFILSLLFGIERQKSHKPIGFGTYIFVSVGSCALAVAAITLNPANPLPLLSGIVTGIGFLGAGALIKTTDKIFGFTTAASIWIFAIFGLLLGIGQYVLALGVYGFIWIVVLIDKYFEKKGFGSYQRKISITTNKIIDEKEIKNIFKGLDKRKFVAKNIDKTHDKMTVAYIVEGDKLEVSEMLKVLYDKDWLDSCHVE